MRHTCEDLPVLVYNHAIVIVVMHQIMLDMYTSDIQTIVGLRERERDAFPRVGSLSRRHDGAPNLELSVQACLQQRYHS